MKLLFHGLGDLEAHLSSTPSIRYNSDGSCHSASFAMDVAVTLEEGEALTGVIEMLADDNMFLNQFEVENFLRYELTNPTEETTRLLLTQDPVPEPTPDPPEPTEEELLAMAKAGRDEAIITTRDNMVYEGVDVETEYGLEHFTLSEKDQILLLGIYGMMQQGVTSYPYHSVGDTANICTVYSDEDIGKIAVVTFAHITYHESYANMLLQWLNRETDREVVATIQYGAVLPEDLMLYLAMILTSAGIDPIIIPGYPEYMAAQEAANDEGDSEGGAESGSGDADIPAE